MKKGIFRMTALLMAALILMCMTACSGNADVSAPAEDITPNTEVSYELHTELVTDGVLDRFERVFTYGHADEYCEQNAFWCEADITDVHIVRIELWEDTWVTDGVRLFDISLLKSTEVLQYIRPIPEGIPWEAIIYTAGGEQHIYAVSYNGRIGGASFIPIDSLTVVDELTTSAEDEPYQTDDTTTTTQSSETTTTSSAPTTTTIQSNEIMTSIYWVSPEDSAIFAREMTIEGDSKWYVWKALKNLNPGLIPTDCSLLSAELVENTDDVFILNFSASFGTSVTPAEEDLLLRAIANTYIETYNLTAVLFMVEGEYYSSAACEPRTIFYYTEC